jgi:hypothetical protein
MLCTIVPRLYDNIPVETQSSEALQEKTVRVSLHGTDLHCMKSYQPTI